jgi:hypothetical protein
MGSTGYAAVIVLLALWFAWLMSRMAPYSPDGYETLAMMGLAFAAAILVPAILLGVARLVDRRGSRRPSRR